jgi:pilus assembly protein Flp/PilA
VIFSWFLKHLPQENERGASAVEYGLLVGAIAAVIIVVVFALGDNINELFRETCQNVHHGGSFGGASC